MTRRVLALVLFASCGGAPRRPGVSLGRTLAAPAVLESQMDRALARDPGDLRSGLVRALLRDLGGRPHEALDAWTALVDAAAKSRDPIAADVAEAAVHAIEDLEERAPGWRHEVDALAARRIRTPGAIGPLARHSLAEIRARLALRSGDPGAARAREADAGCATSLRVAGPFGPTDLLDFDTVRPPERAGAMTETYDLGPGRGVHLARTETTTACAMNVGGDLLRGGTTVAVGWADLPRATEAVLRVESPNAIRVSVNGVRVLEVDTRRVSAARTHLARVALPAGVSKIAVAMGSRHPNPVLVLSLLRPDGAPAGRWLPAEPASHAATARVIEAAPLPGSLDARIASGQPLDEAEVVLYGMRSLGRGDPTAAREALRLSRSPLGQSLLGVALLSDGALPDELRRERARRAFERAARDDHGLWQARFQIARLLAAEDRVDDAIDALATLEADSPREPDTMLLAADLFTSRGWDAQADAAVARARAANPDACRPLAALYAAARRRSDSAAAEEVARAHIGCDAREDTLLDALRTARRWTEAAAEAERLASLDPERASAWQDVGSVRLAMGDTAAAEAAFARARALEPLDPETERQLMDLAMSRGDRTAAIGVVDRQMALSPADSTSLLRPRALVEGRNLFGAFRLDGREVIRAFEASGRHYDAPSVLVLDYTVVRVLPDGSSLELTHNIIHVQSDEGVEQWGEWSPPEGADVLTVRTVKADGTRLEPEEIAGKETLSLPNLGPGDYVEYEYIAAHGAAGGFPGGFFGDRFYFRSFEIPFDRTQLTMVIPKDLDLVVSPRDGAPVGQEEDWEGLRVVRFRMDAVTPLVAEPRSVSSREFLPSVQLSRDASWGTLVRSLRDQLVDKARRDPEVDRLVAHLVAGADRRSERTRRIWKWVLANVDDQGDPFGQASHVILSKSGSRVRALHAMLEAAGVPAELALARDLMADETRTDVADPDTYEHLLVRAETDEGVVWLAPWDRHLPYGYLPAAVRGEPVLLLAPAPAASGASARLPEGEPGVDRLVIRAEATLAADGGGTVTVKETYRGAGAVRWRGALAEIPVDDRETRFEQEYVGRLMEGATLRSLAVEGLDDPDAPLVLSYVFEVPRLARALGGALQLRALYPMVLGPDYAPLSARHVPMAIPEAVDLDVRVDVSLPAGARPGVPPTVRASGPFGRFDGHAHVEEGKLVLERRLEVHPGRIAPDGYADFATFCRTVDRFETAEIRIELRE